MRDTVSIIIPCFNAERYIAQTVRSCLEQRNSAVEVIVVNDGSTDGTMAVLDGMSGNIRVLSQGKRGACAARNLGFKAATGDWIKFLDADDWLFADAISAQLGRYQREPLTARDIVCGYAQAMDQNETLRHDVSRWSEDAAADPLADALLRSPLTSCPLHPRAAIEQIGGFDESLPRYQEFDLHFRLALAGYRFRHFPDPVYAWRVHDSETRISNGSYARFGSRLMLDVLLRYEALVAKHVPSGRSHECSAALACHHWRAGRGLAREGFRAEAQSHFEQAKRLDPGNPEFGRFGYRCLTKLLGPLVAETVLMQLKRGLARLCPKTR